MKEENHHEKEINIFFRSIFCFHFLQNLKKNHNGLTRFSLIKLSEILGNGQVNKTTNPSSVETKDIQLNVIHALRILVFHN